MIPSVSHYISVHAPWLLTVMVVWVVLYFLVLRFLNIGVRRIPRSVRLTDAQCMPISVIVSARNQERDLPSCISSLLALDYPRELLQIVLVNDRSTDNSGAIIDAAAAHHAHVIALPSHASLPSGLGGSARGIAHGFSAAVGEWMLVIDASVVVRPEWVRHLLGYVDAKTGVAAGALLVRADGWLGAVERMALAFLQTFNFGLAGWGAPIVCASSNMAIRRSVYEEAVGLRGQKSRDAEEFAWFEMVKARKLGVHLYMDSATTATRAPVQSAQELLSAHRRWVGEGLAHRSAFKVPLPIALVWAWGLAMFVLLAWLLDWRVWAAFLVLKTTHDFLMLRLQQKRMQTPHHVRYLPVLELYQLVTFAILPFIFLFRQRNERSGDGYAVRNS
ncbi:MAG: glycosyltransferase [Gemmatimonas sp.]